MDWVELIKLIVAGAIGGLVSPLVNWGIEKRRETRAYKRATIQRWRNFIDNLEGWYIESSFQDTSIYSEIKPFLDKEMRAKIEVPRNTLTLQPRPGIVVEGISPKQLLLDEIERIEKDVWHLL
jgi:hypothetical protein